MLYKLSLHIGTHLIPGLCDSATITSLVLHNLQKLWMLLYSSVSWVPPPPVGREKIEILDFMQKNGKRHFLIKTLTFFNNYKVLLWLRQWLLKNYRCFGCGKNWFLSHFAHLTCCKTWQCFCKTWQSLVLKKNYFVTQMSDEVSQSHIQHLGPQGDSLCWFA